MIDAYAYYIARADNTPAGAVELETAGFTPPLTEKGFSPPHAMPLQRQWSGACGL